MAQIMLKTSPTAISSHPKSEQDYALKEIDHVW